MRLRGASGRLLAVLASLALHKRQACMCLSLKGLPPRFVTSCICSVGRPARSLRRVPLAQVAADTAFSEAPVVVTPRKKDFLQVDPPFRNHLQLAKNPKLPPVVARRQQ